MADEGILAFCCGELEADRDLLAWLHAEAVFQRDEALREVARWKRAWQGADREWAKDRAELQRERSSRQAWADEAMRLTLQIDRYANAYFAPKDGLPAEPIPPRWWGLAPPKDGPCACISDDQASQLGPGFSRPVCAVHADDPRMPEWRAHEQHGDKTTDPKCPYCPPADEIDPTWQAVGCDPLAGNGWADQSAADQGGES